MTIICSPNNPTGGRLVEDDLSRLLEIGSGLLVIDEAYHELPITQQCRYSSITTTWLSCERFQRPWPWLPCALVTCWQRRV